MHFPITLNVQYGSVITSHRQLHIHVLMPADPSSITPYTIPIIAPVFSNQWFLRDQSRNTAITITTDWDYKQWDTKHNFSHTSINTYRVVIWKRALFRLRCYLNLGDTGLIKEQNRTNQSWTFQSCLMRTFCQIKYILPFQCHTGVYSNPFVLCGVWFINVFFHHEEPCL